MKTGLDTFRELAAGLAEKTGLQALRRYLKYGSADIFSMVSLETITACNRRCAYCPNSKFDRGLPANAKKMETGLFRKVIDELAVLARAGWAGDIQPNLYGEPLLDERLPELVAYARERLRASPISLFTNGDLLNVERYGELVRAGVTRFAVTRHSPEAPAGMNAVLEYRRLNGDGGIRLTYEKLSRISNKGGLVEVAEPVSPLKCLWVPTTVGVYYDGRVSLCCNDYFGSVDLGNIGSERLLDIWNKPFYRRFRADVRRGKFTLELCNKCREGRVPGPRQD